MAAQRKIFKIEAFTPTLVTDNTVPREASPSVAAGGDAIMDELRAIRALVSSPEAMTRSMIETYKSEMAEAAKLKSELDTIYRAINQTKHEIATLHVTGFKGKEMTRVTHELDAIVDGTQTATEGILSAAEDIDQMCSTLSARLKSTQDHALIDDMQQRIISIFEQCNFQDLTGQRINKVVNTLKFIEEHVGRMMDIWGGLDSFKDIEVEIIAEREGDAALVNGPKLADEAGHASQDDIDALFS